MIKRYTIKLFITLILITAPSVTFAEELPSGTATIRLSIDTEPIEQPQSLWRQALKLLGIRGSIIQYPDPGTGVTVRSSAYAPSPYQTDSTPCITAAGTRVRPGVVATNFLPLGTLLEINNEVYIVEDRMNPRYTKSIDIFFPSTSEALEFGKQELDVVIIGYGEPGQVLPRELAEEVDESTNVVEARTKSSFRERLAERINRWQRAAGSLIGIRYSDDVNRYDVDCFSQE